MNWIVVSRRVGIPGAAYTPKPGDNLDALVANGFIRSATVNADLPAAPSRKVTKRAKE